MSERRTTRGGRGGGAPRQPQCSTLRVLACHHNSGKPATRGTRKNVLPGIARNGLDRAVAGKLLGLLKDGEGRRAADLVPEDGGALLRRPCSALPRTPRRPETVDGVDAPSRRHRDVP